MKWIVLGVLLCLLVAGIAQILIWIEMLRERRARDKERETQGNHPSA